MTTPISHQYSPTHIVVVRPTGFRYVVQHTGPAVPVRLLQGPSFCGLGGEPRGDGDGAVGEGGGRETFTEELVVAYLEQ